MTKEEALEGQRCLLVLNEFMMDYYQKHKNMNNPKEEFVNEFRNHMKGE